MTLSVTLALTLTGPFVPVARMIDEVTKLSTTFQTIQVLAGLVRSASSTLGVLSHASGVSRGWMAASLVILASLGGIVWGQNGDKTKGTFAVTQNDANGQKQNEAIATLAGGCFWCTEAVFERMEGVNDVISGYIGGHVPNPTYEAVCQKTTGHAEAIEVYYDPSKVTFEELLEVFFKTHDPTTPDQQGNDYGPQYRSSIFYHNAQQKQIAEGYIAKLNASKEFASPVVTKLEEATRFYEAEDYHQDYFRKNPTAGYCRFVVREKVKKFDTYFPDKQKKSAPK